MSNETIKHTYGICGTASEQSACESIWECPKCRKVVRNPDVRKPDLTSQQKADIVLEQYIRELDKAIVEGMGFLNFETNVLGSISDEEMEFLEATIRRAAAKDERISITSLHLTQRCTNRCEANLHFNLTNSGRRYHSERSKTAKANAKTSRTNEFLDNNAGPGSCGSTLLAVALALFCLLLMFKLIA